MVRDGYCHRPAGHMHMQGDNALGRRNVATIPTLPHKLPVIFIYLFLLVKSRSSMTMAPIANDSGSGYRFSKMASTLFVLNLSPSMPASERWRNFRASKAKSPNVAIQIATHGTGQHSQRSNDECTEVIIPQQREEQMVLAVEWLECLHHEHSLTFAAR